MSARDKNCPKLSAVSAIVNAQKVQNYIFRNYEYPQGVGSTYKGSMNYKMWEAVKASSAAPGYFEECKFGDLVFQVCCLQWKVFVLKLKNYKRIF